MITELIRTYGPVVPSNVKNVSINEKVAKCE